jgi:hypothetical protein
MKIPLSSDNLHANVMEGKNEKERLSNDMTVQKQVKMQRKESKQEEGALNCPSVIPTTAAEYGGSRSVVL